MIICRSNNPSMEKMNFGDELIKRSDTIISMGSPAAATALFSDQIILTTTTTSPPLFIDIPCELEADKTTSYSNNNNYYSLGFLDALYPSQDNNYTLCSNNTIFDLIHTTTPPPPIPESSRSEVVDTPPTPNSSSLSLSSSNEANDDQQSTKKQLKPKKKNQKSRQREAKFAFMTKSEVDHLDDGFRWRKYGQKAVKNTHFPRSYYRCTSGSCLVKKRVERWYEDPSIVVTTYEGTHTHPCPIKQHAAGGIIAPNSLFGAGITTNRGGISYCYDVDEDVIVPPHQHLHYFHHTHPAATITTYAASGAAAYSNSSISTLHTNTNLLLPQQTRRLLPPPPSSSSLSLIPDHGLLQDMVPSYMVKDEPNQH